MKRAAIIIFYCALLFLSSCSKHNDPVIVNKMGCTPVVIEAGSCGSTPQSVTGLTDASLANSALQGKWNWQIAYSESIAGTFTVTPSPDACNATLTFNSNGTYDFVNGNNPKISGTYVIDQEDISYNDATATWSGPRVPNLQMHVTLSPTPDFTISNSAYPPSSVLTGLLSVSSDGKCLELWQWSRDAHTYVSTSGSKWVR